jgi:hypothetical protein
MTGHTNGSCDARSRESRALFRLSMPSFAPAPGARAVNGNLVLLRH